MADPAAILVAARDEEHTIAATVSALKERFPASELIVADDGSRDATAAEAERAGARVVSLARRGKGQALTLAEKEAPAGGLLLADADLAGDLAPLVEANGDLAVAVFAERRGGGFGIAKSGGEGARSRIHRLLRPRAAVGPAAPLCPRRGRSAFRSPPASAARCA